MNQAPMVTVNGDQMGPYQVMERDVEVLIYLNLSLCLNGNSLIVVNKAKYHKAANVITYDR